VGAPVGMEHGRGGESFTVVRVQRRVVSKVRIDLERLGKYPDGCNTYPSGMSTRVNEIERAGKEVALDNPSQYARDVANREWYDKVEAAYKVISQDVNGNGGLALARIFADEHPELQHMTLDALRAGMLLRHPELLKYMDGKIDAIRRSHIDGRVRVRDAEFVVQRDIRWED